MASCLTPTSGPAIMMVEVNNTASEKLFLRLPSLLYRDDPEWVAPLEADVKSVFDSRKNSLFAHGACARWIASDGNGRVVGRIAAFIDYKKAAAMHTPTGGIGFFECVQNEQVAHQLFDTAKGWLQQRSMRSMEGPVNFGESEKFWGLLVDGFRSPSFGMNYNPAYYQHLFESYGFIKLYDQYTNVLDIRRPLPERFSRISDWVMQKGGYSFRHFTLRDKETFFQHFAEVYNDAWKNFADYYPLSVDAIRDAFRQLEPLVDEKIIWFAYYKQEPIALILCMPDVNQVLKKLKGRLHLLNKLRFLWLRRATKINRIRIVVMGCKQRFQNRGIESALIRCLQQEILPRNTIDEVELAWVGDYNKKMMALHKATGATPSKVHRTYHYLFQ